MFEEDFDFWVAKKILGFLKEGFDFNQTVCMMSLVYSDICDGIDDNSLRLQIKEKIKGSLELFRMGE